MAKTQYDMAYMKTNCRAYRLQLNKEHDKDIIALLEQQTNVNGFLKAVLRKHIETEKGETK